MSWNSGGKLARDPMKVTSRNEGLRKSKVVLEFIKTRDCVKNKHGAISSEETRVFSYVEDGN